MNGTRRGDFSRRIHTATSRAGTVYLQQGRPLLDSDWNAQADVVDHRLSTGLRDLIGPNGAPSHAPGFEIFALYPTAFPGERHALLPFPPLAEEHVDWLLARGFTLELCVRPARSEPTSPEPVVLVAHHSTADAEPSFVLELHRDRLHLDGRPLHEGRLRPRAIHLVSITVRRRAVQVVLDGRLVDRHVLEEDIDFRPGVSRVAVLQSAIGAPGHELLEARLWSFALGVEQIRRIGPLLPPRLRRLWGRLDGAEPPRLLGLWRAESGGRLRDQGPHEEHGETLGEVPSDEEEVVPLELGVGPGRIYVDGVACELDGSLALTDQPDFPGAESPSVRRGEAASFLVYLDVWRRTVVGLEDPDHLLEPALGGIDTAVRETTLAQVKWLPLEESDADRVSRSRHALRLPAWRRLVRTERGAALAARVEDVPGVDLGNGLFRVEIHGHGQLLGTPWRDPEEGPARVWSQGPPADPPVEGALRLAPPEGESLPWRPGDLVELAADDEASGDSSKRVLFEVLTPADGGAAILGPVEAPGREARHGELPTASRDEPALLRWRPIASFKWARHNASSLFPLCHGGAVPDAHGPKPGEPPAESGRPFTARLALEPTSRGELDLAPGAFVELVDDTATLREEGRPLWQIADLAQGEIEARTLFVDDDFDARDHHPHLRLWDQRSERGAMRRDHGAGDLEDLVVTRAGVIPMEHGARYRLDAGPTIDFEAGDYRTGDYWAIEVRGRDLDWARDDEGRPERRKPDGVDHHPTPLAVVRVAADGRLDVVDLRRTFAAAVDGFVGKVGAQTMEGPLDVDRGLVADELVARGGRVVGDLDGRLLRPHVVETQHVVPGAVGLDQLAPEVGVVPPGFFLLGPTPESPPGFEYTGVEMPFYGDREDWKDRDTLAGAPPGKVRLVTVDRRLFAFFEAGDVWEYDPATGEGRPRQDMEPQRDFAVAVIENRVHVVGGFDAAGRGRTDHSIFDPASDTWERARPLEKGRGGLAAASFDTRLHVFGGESPGFLGRRTITNDHSVYDARTDQWFQAASLPAATSHGAAAATTSGIHFVGGVCPGGLFGFLSPRATAAHCLYLPHADQWSHLAPLPAARHHVSLAVLGDHVYALGGRAPLGLVDDHHRYESLENQWQRQRPLHVPLESPGVTFVGDEIFVLGAPAAAGGTLVESRRAAARAYLHRRL